MPTYAELSVRLLNEAAGFFRSLGEQREPVREQMNQNAAIFEQVAELIAKDPMARIAERTHAEMGIKLMQDAAGFFRMLAGENESIRAQMTQNAALYDQMAGLLKKNPHGQP